jgi:hypothetical protein
VLTNLRNPFSPPANHGPIVLFYFGVAVAAVVLVVVVVVVVVEVVGGGGGGGGGGGVGVDGLFRKRTLASWSFVLHVETALVCPGLAQCFSPQPAAIVR